MLTERPTGRSGDEASVAADDQSLSLADAGVTGGPVPHHDAGVDEGVAAHEQPFGPRVGTGRLDFTVTVPMADNEDAAEAADMDLGLDLSCDGHTKIHVQSTPVSDAPTSEGGCPSRGDDALKRLPRFGSPRMSEANTLALYACENGDAEGPMPPSFENFKGPRWQAELLHRVEKAAAEQKGIPFELS